MTEDLYPVPEALQDVYLSRAFRPWSIWVRAGVGRQRLVDLREWMTPVSKGERPAAHDPNYFADGTFKYVQHANKYGKKPKDELVIEDAACEEGRAHWPDYVVLPDGREGPRPFRSESEKRAYHRLTGIREMEPGEPFRR